MQLALIGRGMQQIRTVAYNNEVYFTRYGQRETRTNLEIAEARKPICILTTD